MAKGNPMSEREYAEALGLSGYKKLSPRFSIKKRL
jgi:hypothetical protein